MHKVLCRTSKGLSPIILGDELCAECGVSSENVRSSLLFMGSWLTLLSDSPLNGDDSAKPLKTYQKFINDWKSEGLRNIILRYSKLSHEFASRHLIMGQSRQIGDWIDDFKDTPLFFEYNRYIKSGDISLFKFIYNFLCFGKKLEYVDDSFNSIAFRNWSDIEDRLARLTYLDEDIQSLRRIMSAVLPRFRIESFYPKFGPGSVQEKGVRNRITKIEQFAYDGIVDRFLYHGHIGMYGSGEEHGLSSARTVPNRPAWASDRRVSSRIARLMFRPKDLKVARSICKEPNVLQYYQQGILRVMLDLIDSSPFSKFIQLENQAINRVLAQWGSINGSIDTIDLSSASDCLSFELVKKCFPPSWQIPMRVTRSHSAYLPDGSRRVLKKFAPMGSALCFPTQCVLFTSVIVYAACRYTYSFLPEQQPFLDWLTPEKVLDVIGRFSTRPLDYISGVGQFNSAAVYGDDICVDSRLTTDVMFILDRLGFVVNRQKSFTGGQAFRESCGGYYLNGFDVTPLFYRVKGVRRTLSANHLASSINLINQCWLYGFKNLYTFQLRLLLGWETRFRSYFSDLNPIPFKESTSDSFGVIAKNPHNAHLRRRVHPDYQRDEQRCIQISELYRISDSTYCTDEYEYMRWMSSRHEGCSSPESSGVPRYDSGGARMRWRWIPTVK